MVARHQPHPTVDVIRIRATDLIPNDGHPSTLAPFVSTLVEIVCDADLLACARNTVLNEVSGDWVVFVDHSVEVHAAWVEGLGRDLAEAATRPDIACSVGSTGTSTLDVAYRRSAIDLLGPFGDPTSDEWTTDLDMQLRLVASGHSIDRGSRLAH